MKLKRSRFWWLRPYAEVRRQRAWIEVWRGLYAQLTDAHEESRRELGRIKRKKSDAVSRGNYTRAANRRAAAELRTSGPAYRGRWED